MIDICSHRYVMHSVSIFLILLTSFSSEENGKNMVCQDGKKLVCYICGSYDHMLEVSLK